MTETVLYLEALFGRKVHRRHWNEPHTSLASSNVIDSAKKEHCRLLLTIFQYLRIDRVNTIPYLIFFI